MNHISRDELRRLLDAGTVTLVEALPAAAYESEHIPGAVNVPAALTAELATRIAERLGYTDVHVYPGGKADWAEAGLPLDGTRARAAAR